MNYYVTYKNTNYDNYGININQAINNIQSFILNGGVGGSERKFSYIPEYITNYTDSHKTIRNYVIKTNLIQELMQINTVIDNFYQTTGFNADNKQTFYNSFQIPKRNGRGFRQIVAPSYELKQIQRAINDFIAFRLRLHPHDAAHGFVKGRDGVTNANMHKQSKHIVNIDLKNFFPSISTEVLQKGLKSLLPFVLLHPGYANDYNYRNVIPLINKFYNDIINIATLNGALPQGSPLSPLLSNLIMIPIDHAIKTKLSTGEFSSTYVIYTRYVDDTTFSSLHPIKLRETIDMITDTLDIYYNNQIKINEEKIKYLKNTHKCYVTGVKINEHNNTTLGHEKKKELKHKIFYLFTKHNEGTLTKEELQETMGQFAWLYRIEPDYANYLQNRYLRQFNSQFNKISDHFKELLR